MPPLLLDDEEAIAIAVGLRTAAQASIAGIEETSVRALVKLEQVLPKHLRRRVQALGEVETQAYAVAGTQVDPECLTTTAFACRDGERLRFGYEARDGSASRRVVEPRSLVNLGRRWYLLAWDLEREDWRTFRLDRMTKPAPAGGRVSPRELPDGKDPVEYVASNLSGASGRYDAVVVVDCPAEELSKRPHLWGTVEPLGKRRCLYRTSEDHLDWLAMRIAMLGHPFEVREPPELIEGLRELGRRVDEAVARSG
jgi:predicted DNA-binding transcriptional regulator YafY